MKFFSHYRTAAAIVFLALAAPSAFGAGPRVLEFGGLGWSLRRTAGPSAPGPNTFSDAEDQAWIDPEGRLHLAILRREQGWTAVELTARAGTGYGVYRFTADGSLRRLDPNVVFGFFTWDRTPERHNREMDIEISRWGNPDGPDGWFTVQPYDRAGNQHSFRLPPAASYDFGMKWEPGSVSFWCDAEGGRVAAWSFRKDVPDPGRVRIHINLWLFRGTPPASSGPQEVILSDFRWEPLE